MTLASLATNSNLNRTKLTVRTVNPAIAKFISLSPEAQLVLISSSNQENSNIFKLGSSASNQEAYFSLNNNKLISFSPSNISIPTTLTVQGHLSGNASNNLGSHTNKWKDIYLDGNIIQINNALIDYEINDPNSCQCHISDISFYDKITNDYIPIAAESLHIQHVDDYYAVLSINQEGIAVITSYRPDHSLINSINIGEGTTAMLPQGSNLYFSASRVSELALSINLNSTSYEATASNNLQDQITTTSNNIFHQASNIPSTIATSLNTSSNLISSNITSSNIVSSNLITYMIDTLTSNINVSSNNHINLIYASDTNISNIIETTSNIISSNIIHTSNILSTSITTSSAKINLFLTSTSNQISSSITSSSNNIIRQINATANTTSNIISSSQLSLIQFITTTSNTIASNISLQTSNTSNYITTHILTSLSSNITSSSNSLINQFSSLTSNVSNFITQSSNNFIQAIYLTSNSASNTIANLTADHILTNSTHQFIVNNTYNGDLKTSNITVIGNLSPAKDQIYSLGSPSFRWKELYISGNTIYLNNIAISSDPVTKGITIKDAVTEAPIEIIASSIKIQDTQTGELTILKSTNNELNVTSQSDENALVQINSDQVQQGSKLFFKPELVAEIAAASNIAASNYITATYDQISSNISALTLDQIKPFSANSSNKFIVNGTVGQNLRVNATVSASNLNVIGEETYIRTASFKTENIEIISQTYTGPSLSIVYNASNLAKPSVLEFYYSTSNEANTAIISKPALVIKDDGKIGINTSSPSATLDVIGNIKFSGSINGISSNTLNYLKDVACNIQKQINDTNTHSSNYGSNISNLFQSSLHSTSNSSITTLSTFNASQSNITSNINNWMLNILSSTTTSINTNINSANTSTSNIIGRTIDTYTASIQSTSNVLVTLITNLTSNMSNTITITSNQQLQQALNTSNDLDTRLTGIIQNRWQLVATSNLYITSNVGIGTLTPTANLDIIGNIKFSQRLILSTPSTSVTSNELNFLQNLTAPIQVQIDNTSNSSSNFIALTSSNLTSNLNQLANTLNQRITQLDTDTSNYTSNIFILTLTNTRLGSTSNNINTRIDNLNFSKWATSATSNSFTTGSVGIGTSSILAGNKLEIFGGDLQITGGNIKKLISAQNTIQQPTISFNGSAQNPIPLSGNDYYYAFTSNASGNTGTITFSTSTVCDILVIGGGGSGGTASGGGGGAGGVVYQKGVTLTSGTYTVTVGAGGSAVTTENTVGNSGSPSTIMFNSAILSLNGISYEGKGGGGGGSYNSGANNNNGKQGGSGGGGAGGDIGSPGGSGGSATQGNTYFDGTTTVAGGKSGNAGTSDGSSTSIYKGGGGGGASSTASTVINGGDGVMIDITGTNRPYAAGGGAGIYSNANSVTLSGGIGGSAGSIKIGGDGNVSYMKDELTRVNVVAVGEHDGVNDTGSGGGGGSMTSFTKNGGAGGSGIVIIKWTASIISNNNVENYQLERWKDSETYYAQSGPQFIYYQEGNVGIGTNNPVTNVHIAYNPSGFTVSQARSLRYFSCNIDFTQGSHLVEDTCAFFDSSILVKDTIAASSDQRIKTNILDINDDSALQKILSIQPKTYNYVDPLKSSEKVYGFIAQQIQEVIPEAIHMQKAVVPNIFCTASCFLNLITFDASVDFKLISIDTKLSIIDMTGNQEMYTVTYVSSSSITIDRNIPGDLVFVYGTEVDDFHSLDKSYIYTLNVCATQKLSQKLNNLTERMAMIENIIQEF